MKKLITFITIFFCTVTLISAATKGKCGDNVKWTFDAKTGELYIYGTGPMYSDPSIKQWEKKKSQVKTVIIGEGVTSIGDYAFNLHSRITSVSIPQTVTIIGENAFYGCNNLEQITLPDNITQIGDDAFRWCKIKEIVLPYSLEEIGSRAFTNCNSLTEITINSKLKRIGIDAFSECPKLKFVYIDDLTSWCKIDFANNGSNPAKFIYGFYIKNRLVTDLVIPNDITKIKDYAFYGCHCFKSITIPEGVKTIGNHSFDTSGYLTITIPKSVTSFGTEAVSYGRVREIYYTGSLEDWCNKPWDPQDISTGYSLYINSEELTSVVVPKTVTKIMDNAFYNCLSITKVYLHPGITYIGGNAFNHCNHLEFILIPERVKTIGENAFKDCVKVSLGNSVWGSNMTVYTASSVSLSKTGLCSVQDGIKYNKVIRLKQSELMYMYPFSVYAQEYVEKRINEWQKKGEFERTSDWQARVNEQTRKKKISELLADAEQRYIAKKSKEKYINPALGKYDADNEVFLITDENYGTAYMPVPYEDAQDFKANWGAKKMNPQWQMIDDKMKLSALTITMPNGKQYTYRNTDVVNYNLAEIAYNFDPIDLGLSKNTTPQQNQQNNQKNTIRAGKSLVDTNIPVTKASNPNTFVLIFANEDYKNAASVPFAKNDGTVFQKYCQKTLGIPAKNIHYVENATFNDMRIQLAWAKDVCEAFEGQASLIVYYTGHGIPDEASGAPYLLPVDGDGRYVASAYNLDEFYQKIGAMNAKSVTVLLDACFSGASRDGNMVAQAKGVVLQPRPGKPQGKTVVFAAAQNKETAGFNEAEGHGMFTYFLLKKLQETKGDVTLSELGDYIITNVKKESVVQAGKKQTPTVLSSPALGSEWQNWKLR